MFVQSTWSTWSSWSSSKHSIAARDSNRSSSRHTQASPTDQREAEQRLHPRLQLEDTRKTHLPRLLTLIPVSVCQRDEGFPCRYLEVEWIVLCGSLEHRRVLVHGGKVPLEMLRVKTGREGKVGLACGVLKLPLLPWSGRYPGSCRMNPGGAQSVEPT
jgi:hypothetical protein